MPAFKETLSGSIRGDVVLTQMVEHRDFRIPLAKADAKVRQRIRDFVWNESGVEVQDQIKKSNLVVNMGRDTLARQLGGEGSRAWISRVQLGDTKVSGVVSKDLFPPDLSDNRLVHEIRTLLGAPGATFELDPTTYPAVVIKTQPAGLPGTLTAGVTSTFTDATADFVAAGITDKDKVTVFIGGEDFALAVRAVLSTTQLEVENPSLLSGAGLAYKVTTPGGQVLFRKRVDGNNFPESLFGPLTIAHEAGLLFNDGSLFNRVIFAPGSPTVGLAFSPRNVDGITLSAQLDWLITF
jgi:hypothetical protein